MSTCCPTFRAALLVARAADRRARTDAFEGFGDASTASAALAALEGAKDTLPQTEPEARYALQLRVDRARRARKARRALASA